MRQPPYVSTGHSPVKRGRLLAHPPSAWLELTSRRQFIAAMAACSMSPLLLGLTGCRRSAPADGVIDAIEPIAATPFRPPLPQVEPFVRVRVGRVRGVPLTERSANTENGESEDAIDPATPTDVVTDPETDAGSDPPIVPATDPRDRSFPVIYLGSEGQMLRIAHPESITHYIAARGPLQIGIGFDGWHIIDSRGVRLPIFELTPVHLMPLEREADGESIAMDERRFPGVLTLVPMTHVDPVAFDVVNHVRIEQYLPGVVMRELYNHWHVETHAAQAVAARSFACSERAWWAERRHFDLTDTQRSQVYAGMVTHQRSLDAVARTRGMVLGYDEHLVPAYYSSCCGGTAARAIDAIGPNPINDIPPLHGQPDTDVCTGVSVARWRYTYERSVISRRIARFGRARNLDDLAGLKSLRAIEMAEVNPHGRPVQFALSDDAGGLVLIGAETLRHAINQADGAMPRLRHALRSSHVEVERDGGNLIFDGRGFGHGVGMCQHGAELRARDGESFSDILLRYYPGAAIVRAYA
jgi:SpoIID/LytB domain protein